MVDLEASDLFLKVGSLVHLRIDGRLRPQDSGCVSRDDMRTIIGAILSERQKKIYEENSEVDFIADFEELGRFRGSLFNQNGLPSIVFRYIKSRIRAFEDLNLPVKILKQLSLEKRGLVLVTRTFEDVLRGAK